MPWWRFELSGGALGFLLLIPLNSSADERVNVNNSGDDKKQNSHICSAELISVQANQVQHVRNRS